MAYPHPRRVHTALGDVGAGPHTDLGSVPSIPLRTNESETYRSLYSFFSSNKPTQRELLAGAGLPVPETYQTHSDARYATPGAWISRPLRHSGGLGYRRTEDVSDFTEGEEYIQRVYPKDREYRLIYVYGQHLITLRKKVPEGLTNDQPWNHSNGAFFQTIHHWENCRLASTDILARLQSLPIIMYAHIVAVDVMWSNSLGYSVCELNACPGLTIDNNLRKVAAYVSEHQGLDSPAV